MSLLVAAPLAGRVLALADVPDPVFAEAMVGPGLAIDPTAEVAFSRGPTAVLAPVAGRLGAVHPHAFAVEAAQDAGAGVLVHLGLDTVTLHGAGFTVLAHQGEQVRAGQPVIEWDPAGIGALSPLVPVIALGAQAVQALAEPGDLIRAGADLFSRPGGAGAGAPPRTGGTRGTARPA